MALPRDEMERYRDLCVEQSKKAQSEGQEAKAAKFCELRLALDGLLESVLENKTVEEIFTKIHKDIHRLLDNSNSASIRNEAL